jgi:ATP-dependent helicase/DNAse subunit B
MAITAILLDSSKEKPKLDLSLSVSKAKTFDDCKAKYKFCYIQKLPRIDRDFHIFGKFLHSTLESFHKTIIQNPEQKDQWK